MAGQALYALAAMAKKSSLQIWVEYALVRSILGVLGVMPRRAAVASARKLGWLAFHLLGSLRKTGMRNLQIAFPEKTVPDQREILLGTFDNLGRVLGEMSQFSKADVGDLKRIVDFSLDDTTRELYEKNKTQGRGVLITTGHLGNWELLVFAFAALHEPISYLARPIDNPLIEQLTVRLRTRFGNRPINKTNSAMLVSKLLRGGEILGILADVNAHPKEGVFVPFFGVQACTPSGAALVAIRSNAYIFPTFCVWDKTIDRYKFVHGSVLEPVSTGDRKRDVVETTAAITFEIEKLIREYPDQWMWIHKRWKTRPQGESDLYAE